jgi:hypothetical protein
LQRLVIFHAAGDSNWATVALPIVEELEILQDGILLENETMVAAGLFHYAGDGQELPKVTSCGDIASIFLQHLQMPECWRYSLLYPRIAALSGKSSKQSYCS